MGQKASKEGAAAAVRTASRVRQQGVDTSAKAAVAGRQQATPQATTTKKREPIVYNDPNARLQGFTRGGGRRNPKELEQKVYLMRKMGLTDTDQVKDKIEMQPDLIRFLEDMGPVEEEKKPPKQTQLRQRENVREAWADAGTAAVRGESENQLAAKNTNFWEDDDEEDLLGFGITDVDLHELLVRRRGSVDIDEIVDSFLQEKSESDNRLLSPKEMQRSSARIKECLQYVEAPVLVRASDGDLYGSRPEFTFGFKPVPPGEAKLILDDIVKMKGYRPEKTDNGLEVLDKEATKVGDGTGMTNANKDST